MKVSLTVAVPGDMEGKRIPVTLAEFLIGRDPQCHLCPGSPRVGIRHCAVLVRGNKVFLKNFDKITGTFVNDRRIDGEVQLLDGDWLKIGPLLFCLNIETAASPAHPEDLAAQLLLVEGQDEAAPAPENNQPPEKPESAEGPEPPKPPESEATKAILAKYRRW
jgi:pSer/pThr/pTyr-binding forkhead associated (FHA) protein